MFATSISEADYEEERRRDTYVNEDMFRETLVEAVGMTLEDAAEDVLPMEFERVVQDTHENEPEPEDEGWTREDLDNLQVGDHIHHRSMGDGIVVDFSEGYIRCRVGGKVRMFAIPGAFEGGFLTLDYWHSFRARQQVFGLGEETDTHQVVALPHTLSTVNES